MDDFIVTFSHCVLRVGARNERDSTVESSFFIFSHDTRRIVNEFKGNVSMVLTFHRFIYFNLMVVVAPQIVFHFHLVARNH